MRTFVGVNDPQAVKHWSSTMAVEIGKQSYFHSAFIGKGKNSKMPIQRIDDLERGAGDEVTVDLLMPMSMNPVVGEETLSGKEQNLGYYTDRIRIDQVRGGADLGSRMTRKRTLREFREDARAAHADWWRRTIDEAFFIFLSGERGNDNGFVWDANNKFMQVNELTAPDAKHHMFGGSGVASIAALTNTDGMDLSVVSRAATRSMTMGGDASGDLSMRPIQVEGGEHYVCLMHPFQADSMRAATGTATWLDIQKAAAGADGQKNPIFKGKLGMYRNVVLHEHRNVIRSADAGASGDLPRARALFLGAQAALVAYGDSNSAGARYLWTEEIKDHGNQIAVGTTAIMGIKKTRYKSKDGRNGGDFGVISIDTYAPDTTV